MKKFDVIVLGGGRIGRFIADHLARKQRRVGIISLPDRPEDRLIRHHAVLSNKKMDLVAVGDSVAVGDQVAQFAGASEFVSKNVLRVGSENISAKKFVLAMGCRPEIPAIDGLSQTKYKLTEDFLACETSPKSVVVLGAGAAGVVMAQQLRDKGSSVTLVSDKPTILPSTEKEIADEMTGILGTSGVTIETGASVVSTRSTSDRSVSVAIEQNGIKKEIAAEELVLCAGLKPNTSGFGLDKMSVYVDEKGHMPTNEEMRTSAPWVWAAGSVSGPPFHLSLETAQAEVAAHNVTAPIFDRFKMDLDPLPVGVSSHPPIATIGMGETEAREKRKDVRVCLYRAAPGELIKIIGRRKSGLLLGAHIMAPHAEEMILFFDLVIRAGISLVELTTPQHFVGFSAGEMIHRAIKTWTET